MRQKATAILWFYVYPCCIERKPELHFLFFQNTLVCSTVIFEKRGRDMKKKHAFVFDGDDTLWMTEWQYSEAYATFFRYLYDVLKSEMPALHLAWERYFRKEYELYREWGVRRGRVSEAMAETYKDICLWIRVRFGKDVYDKEHEDRVREIGDLPFQFERLTWTPDACGVLQKLKDDGHALYFLSNYDQNVFPHKARLLGLNRFFAEGNIRITEFKKTKEDFVAVTGWNSADEKSDRIWYAVGNGESDISPALEISERWRGIHIPHGSTSQYFRGKRGNDYWTPDSFAHPRCVPIRSIGELLSVV